MHHNLNLCLCKKEMKVNMLTTYLVPELFSLDFVSCEPGKGGTPFAVSSFDLLSLPGTELLPPRASEIRHVEYYFS